MAPLVQPVLPPDEAAGMELILEGFLLHHGRPRLLDLPERGQQVLAGDFCYAQGLVRVSAAGDLFTIDALADLIALGAGLVARGRGAALAPLWRVTADAVAARRAGAPASATAAFAAAKRALRDRGDDGPLRDLADALAPAPGLEEAFRP
jgi:hypothetical protein